MGDLVGSTKIVVTGDTYRNNEAPYDCQLRVTDNMGKSTAQVEPQWYKWTLLQYFNQLILSQG